MLKISEHKAKRWVRKWEPHKHCSICGLAMDPNPNSEFCSSECEAKYKKWQKKQKKKDKIYTYVMIGSIVLIFVFMVINFLLTPV
ncbi:MAG: DUF2116 family Zn-ribbon domain-containing protein [Candidatus Helarchaeota archaeon]